MAKENKEDDTKEEKDSAFVYLFLIFTVIYVFLYRFVFNILSENFGNFLWVLMLVLFCHIYLLKV